MIDLSLEQELQQRVAKYDLLCHPFYVAWSNGELTRQELAEYGESYYHHVKAFQDYLATLEPRLADETIRSIVARNRREEDGHPDMWLDFAEGMGANRSEVEATAPVAAIAKLMKKFSTVAEQGEAIEAFASFYAYESQVPRVAEAKESGLKERYGADAKSCYYFTVHKTADIHHSNVWVDLIEGELQRRPELRSAALDACETAAASLWHTLDGIEEHRQSKRRLNSCSVGS